MAKVADDRTAWCGQLELPGVSRNTVRRGRGINVWLTYGSPGAVTQEILNASPLIMPVGVSIVRAETKATT